MLPLSSGSPLPPTYYTPEFLHHASEGDTEGDVGSCRGAELWLWPYLFNYCRGRLLLLGRFSRRDHLFLFFCVPFHVCVAYIDAFTCVRFLMNAFAALRESQEWIFT